jgi:hypothetical protein
MAVQSKISRKELTPAERSHLWTLYCEGYSPTQIFKKTGVLLLRWFNVSLYPII